MPVDISDDDELCSSAKSEAGSEKPEHSNPPSGHRKVHKIQVDFNAWAHREIRSGDL